MVGTVEEQREEGGGGEGGGRHVRGQTDLLEPQDTGLPKGYDFRLLCDVCVE